MNRRRPRVKGIGAAARTLGVCRSHLYRVVHGFRPSPSLLARYEALKASQQIPVEPPQINHEPTRTSSSLP